MGNRNIMQIAQSFLSVNKDEFNEIYEKNKLLLLIDNIKFTKNGTEKTTDFHNLNKIIKFKNDYPDIQIIGTSTQEFENLIPEGYLQCNHKFDFNAAFIHSLKTTQIKTLIKKWFSTKEIDFQENLEKLLGNFKQLGLPRTPLSVTMFLWIINKQEKEPVNNAVLVEIFIENLLEKANFDNAFSNSFDFHNKVRLLTYLSKYMLDNGRFESSYSISYIEALQFIQKYLEKKYGDPTAILNNLIERRILSYTNDNYVRFKSSFFFHFFLAQHIDRDPEFKKLVFENCLEFLEELELYSGLKRDSVEVLDLVVSNLAESFKPLNDTILPQFTKIDKFLETKDSLSKHIDLNKAQKKPDEKVMEQAYDETLNNLPVKKDIPLKKLNEQRTIYLDKLLKLASVVLKNSEEIDSFDKRFSSYEIILQSSISFFVMYRQHLLDYFETHKKKPSFFPKNIDFNMFIRFLPLIHQVVLFDWLGSIKMSPLLIEKINRDKKNKDISDFEKFLSVFIFSDMNGENFKKYIDNFYKNTDKKYLLDSAFLKVLTYYYLRSKSDDLDEYYLNLLANIQEKLGRTNAKRKPLLKMAIKKNKEDILAVK